MNEIILLVLSSLLMFVLHEVFHYLSLILLQVEFKLFYISKKGIGFIVDNQYMRYDNKLLFFFLFPTVLSLSVLIDPYSRFLIFFSILNLLWSLSDIGTVSKIRKKPPQRRIDWANEWDRESLENSFFTVTIKF